MSPTPPCVLAVAGSDSAGGAGIQADLKTMLALGVHGMSVICAVTAQNSVGVQGYWEVPADAVRAQLASVLSDISVHAVKTGMLASAAIVETVASMLAGQPAPVVVDPVAVSKHGYSLLSAGTRITDEAGMLRAAEALSELGPRWVLVKGGHLPGNPVDPLFDGSDAIRFPGQRIASRHTHGTGCTLASAIASFLALGMQVPAAVEAAKDYVTGAIGAGFPLGAGIGPVDHAWRIRQPVSG